MGGLRKFMQARAGQSEHHISSATEHTTANNTSEPVEAVSQGISCAKQPRMRADRIAQIQRFADATRSVSKIDYSQLAEEESTNSLRKPDPIIVSPLPAGWRLSSSTGMPVFSYGKWLLSHDDSQMDRATAARQFLRYAR